VTSEDDYDDYKRASTESSVIGVYSTEQRALKVAILRLVEEMLEVLEDRYFSKESARSFEAEVRELCEHCEDETFDVSIGFEEAKALLEKMYGEGEFTMQSSGTRYFVHKMPAVDEELGPDFDKAWTDEFSGLASFHPNEDKLPDSDNEEGVNSESSDSESDSSDEDFEGIEQMEEDELGLLQKEAAEDLPADYTSYRSSTS
jgi:hypothetical protein